MLIFLRSIKFCSKLFPSTGNSKNIVSAPASIYFAPRRLVRPKSITPLEDRRCTFLVALQPYLRVLFKHLSSRERQHIRAHNLRMLPTWLAPDILISVWIFFGVVLFIFISDKRFWTKRIRLLSQITTTRDQIINTAQQGIVP